MEVSKVQKDILVKLLSADGLRHKDTFPKNISSDLHNYHLKYLVERGFVEKQGNRYYLTLDGKKFVEEIVPLNPLGRTGDLFRVNVLTIVLKKVDGNWQVLNQLRKRQPFYGDRGIIGGTVFKGEPIIEAAKRKLIEETNLIAHFKFIGVIRKIRKTVDGKVFSDVFYHVCLSRKFSGVLVEENKFGKNYWCSLDEAIDSELKARQRSDNLIKILRAIKSNPSGNCLTFFEEEESAIREF